jgi:glycosyltransferase involved in cell wall biosynthesis
MDLVSFVIPAYNPGTALLEAARSAREQTHEAVEIIVVNHGTDTAEGKAAIQSVLRLAHHYIEQPNRGVSAARNAGFRAATGAYVVPLDCDDLPDRRYVAECLAAIEAHPEAAFAYTDSRVIGRRKYIERYRDYNLYALLQRNILPYAGLIRKESWEAAGGYDERMRPGHEDWEFWLRLGANARYGHHLGKVLFQYRKSRPALSDASRRHEREAQEYIRENHPELYTYEARARIKAAWEPAACVVGPAGKPALLDCETMDAAAPHQILRNSRAQAFAISRGAAQPDAAEFAALAVWGGNRCVQLPDGSLAVSRPALARCRNLAELSPVSSPPTAKGVPDAPRHLPAALATVHRHLLNAGLLSARPWLKHPVGSALRLVPLRIKEGINHRTGRAIFDLAFYLQFQPSPATLGKRPVTPLCYLPRLDSSRRRVALVTPHLGPGGAETVLLDISNALDCAQFEIFLIATQSSDTRWLERWKASVDHVYDLAALVPPERAASAFYSVVKNWRLETLLIQNSLPAYSVLRELKADVPGIGIMDLIHSVDREWDMVSATTEVAGSIDIRIVISEAARRRTCLGGTPEANIRLIRNGIDLARFVPGAPRPVSTPGRILFAGRLDAVKRPLLLVEIALALKERRGQADFRVIVAGDGPEGGSLRDRTKRAGVAELFDFLGYVPDIAPLLADADLLLLTSRAEGIPLVVLEAFAAGKPVVVSDAGAVGEVVDAATGFLVQTGAGEAEAFAKAIDMLLNSPDLRERMGREARRKVEVEYSRENFRQAYRGLFGASLPV